MWKLNHEHGESEQKYSGYALCSMQVSYEPADSAIHDANEHNPKKRRCAEQIQKNVKSRQITQPFPNVQGINARHCHNERAFGKFHGYPPDDESAENKNRMEPYVFVNMSSNSC